MPQGPPFDPRAVLAALERHYVSYVLIGGLARVLRGADEVTVGVDVCPSFGPGNVDRLRDAAVELGARRTDRQPLALTEDALGGEPLIPLSTSIGTLQIVASPAGAPNGFVDLRRASTKEHLGQGLQTLVASTGDLARMAAALGHDRDIARLPELRRIIELEADRGRTIAPVEPHTSARKQPARTRRAAR